jgi:arabinan endo-1,5-alpha-L-arabinosidase
MKRHAPANLVPGALAVIAAAGLLMGQAGAPNPMPATPQEVARKMGMQHGVTLHDPSTIVKCGDEFWVFATGKMVPSFHSPDLVNWTSGGPVLADIPEWVPQEVPGFRSGSFWAPDVIKVKDKYLLFFSASAFGVNTSTIGVISTPTLTRSDPAYKWTDQGKVVTSHTDDDFNAIDPAAILDTDGRLWMAFGSFWSGIKLIELNPDNGRRIAENSPMYTLAHYDSTEGAYLYKRDKSYFLFVSMGMCCRKDQSTYNMRVGRSDRITGPYLDKDGKDMLLGGGTPVMASHIGPLIGPGHAGIVEKDGKSYLSFHVESNAAGGQADGTFGIRPVTWDARGWPVVGDVE